MVILSFLFQKEAFISLTHLLLCQQSTVYDQRYKNVGKLNKSVMGCFGHKQFYFILFYFIFSDFTFLFLYLLFFFFGDDEKGTWQGSHMICHMMWHHRPRTWWKNLESDVRAHGVCIVVLSKKWGEHEVEAWTIGQV